MVGRIISEPMMRGMPMREMREFVVLFMTASLWPMPSQAFSLSDHSRITAQAVREFNACLPGSIGEMVANRIDEYNLDEDTNLLNKWLFYSHYFHPFKELNMARYQSSVRVEELEKQIHSALDGGMDARDDSILNAFSHALHHLQDMASPPHVVPVTHWLTDGFETYEVAFEIPRTSTDDCVALIARPKESLVDLLKHAARTTLNLVRSERVSVQKNGSPTFVSWSSFWAESSENDFGDYGVFGNSYGEAAIQVNGDRYRVAPAVYHAFKHGQLRLAVEISKRAFLQVFRRWR
jgi:hypothetical protein